jgi:hypothetical protein
MTSSINGKHKLKNAKLHPFHIKIKQKALSDSNPFQKLDFSNAHY